MLLDLETLAEHLSELQCEVDDFRCEYYCTDRRGYEPVCDEDGPSSEWCAMCTKALGMKYKSAQLVKDMAEFRSQSGSNLISTEDETAYSIQRAEKLLRKISNELYAEQERFKVDDATDKLSALIRQVISEERHDLGSKFADEVQRCFQKMEHDVEVLVKEDMKRYLAEQVKTKVLKQLGLVGEDPVPNRAVVGDK